MPKSYWHQSILRNYWSLSYLHLKLRSLCCSSNPSYSKRCFFLLWTEANHSTGRSQASSHRLAGNLSHQLLIPHPHYPFCRHFTHRSQFLPHTMWPWQSSKTILQSFWLNHPQQPQIEILASQTRDLWPILSPQCTSTLPHRPTKLDHRGWREV